MNVMQDIFDSFFLLLSKRVHLAERRKIGKPYCGVWTCTHVHWGNVDGAPYEDYRVILLKKADDEKQELKLINCYTSEALDIDNIINNGDRVLVRMRKSNEKPHSVHVGLNDVLFGERLT